MPGNVTQLTCEAVTVKAQNINMSTINRRLTSQLHAWNVLTRVAWLILREGGGTLHEGFMNVNIQTEECHALVGEGC